MRVIIPNVTAEEGAQLTDEELLQLAVVDEYQDLFEEMNTKYAELFAAQNPPLTVTDLVTYYRGLQVVLNNQEGEGAVEKPNPKYFRLPLDEPEFKINMDTRTITVPTAFANYGVGVQGDACAEIVFFTCDRFFDGVDLSAMVPGLSTNADTSAYDCVVQWTNTASRVSQNSKVVLADATEDTITFGWMITQKMTESSGTIEFAVRWMQLENGKIVYSVSTQKASIQVKSTLNLNYDNTEVEDISDLIYTRPFYSGVLNSMEGSAPQVKKNLTAGVLDLVPLTAPTPVEEGAEGYDAYLEAKAAYEAQVAQYPDGTLPLEVEATSPDGMTIEYQWYNGLNMIEGAVQNEYTAVAPGTYYAKIGNNGEAANRGTRYVTTPSVVVPAPDEIKFVALENDYDYFGAKTYSDGQKKLVVAVKNVNGEDANGNVSYVWKRAPLDAPTAFVAINDANTNEYLPTVDDEAYFTCEAVNKKNNAQSATINKNATPVMVRAEPDRPTAVNIVFDEENQMLKIQGNITWPEGSKSIDHPTEWFYKWGCTSKGVFPASAGGSGFGLTQFPLNGLTLENGQPWSDNFYCIVSHIVYNNEGNQKVGIETKSGDVQLLVGLDAATNKVKVTPVTGE